MSDLFLKVFTESQQKQQSRFDCKHFAAGNFQRVSPARRTVHSESISLEPLTAITIPLCTSLWAHSKPTGDKNTLAEFLLFWHPLRSSWRVSAPHQGCEAAARMSRGRRSRSEEAPLFQEHEFQAARSRNAGSSLCPWCEYNRKNFQWPLSRDLFLKYLLSLRAVITLCMGSCPGKMW